MLRTEQIDTEMPSQVPAFRRTVALLMADYRQRIAAKIRYERELRGEDPIDVAYGIGVHLRTYERWEAGEVQPQRRNLRALAARWGIEVRDLRPDLEADEHQLSRIEIAIAELRADVVELGIDLARDKAQEQKWREKGPGADSPGATA